MCGVQLQPWQGFDVVPTSSQQEQHNIFSWLCERINGWAEITTRKSGEANAPREAQGIPTDGVPSINAFKIISTKGNNLSGMSKQHRCPCQTEGT